MRKQLLVVIDEELVDGFHYIILVNDEFLRADATVWNTAREFDRPE